LKKTAGMDGSMGGKKKRPPGFKAAKAKKHSKRDDDTMILELNANWVLEQLQKLTKKNDL
jgi:hypothetical protein